MKHGLLLFLVVSILTGCAAPGRLNLAVESGIMTPETVEPILGRAQARAMALASRIPDALDDELRERLAGAAAAPAPAEEEEEAPAPEEKKKDEDKEEEKVSEEDAAAGLSSLFG